MPKLRTESFTGAGDFRWLRSDHAIWNGRTESLDIGAFTAGTHYPNGYIPSGTPVRARVPASSCPTTRPRPRPPAPASSPVTSSPTSPIVPGSTEDLNVPLLDHGRVNPAFVPRASRPSCARRAAQARRPVHRLPLRGVDPRWLSGLT
jgi:hypothetical protein